MNKSKIFKRAGLFVAASLLSLSQAVQAEINISGWVNEGIIYYDDGQDSDRVQSTDNGTTLATRITFAGSTDTSFGQAGFEIILEPQSRVTPLIFANQDASLAQNLGNDAQGAYRATTGHDIGVLGNSLYISGAGGKLTVGLQSMPTDNIAVLEDPSLTLWSGISPVFRGNGFTIRGIDANGALPDYDPDTDAENLTGQSGQVWGDLLNCFTAHQLRGVGGIGIDCNGIYRQGVRYDLPAFGPVSAAIGWANESVYDISAKYKGQMGRISSQLALGYATNSDPTPGDGSYDEARNFQFQFGLMDPITGLFGSFAFQKEDADLTGTAQPFQAPALVAEGVAPNNIAVGAMVDVTNPGELSDDTTAWWLKVGIKKEWSSIGPTSFAFDYGKYEDQYSVNAARAGVNGSELDRIGFSIDQYFGSSLIIYFKWERLESDFDRVTQTIGVTGADIDGFNNETAMGVEANPARTASFDGEDLDTFTLGFTYFF